MTLRMEQVARQLPGVLDRYRQQLQSAARALDGARRSLDLWAADPETGDRKIQEAMAGSSAPYATSFGERPDLARAAPPFQPATVVSADGSSIEPDRFAAAQCYVINTGLVVLAYGVPGEPLLGSTARVGPDDPSLVLEEEDAGQEEEGPFGWAVNLRRDVAELEAAAEAGAQRAANGEVVVLLDGTLFPWDLDSRLVPEPTRRGLARRTQDALDRAAVAGQRLSLGAYVSGTRSGEVVASLHALSGGPALHSDGALFESLLGDGERSAVFRSRSERVRRVEAMFSPEQQVCFFYLRVADDVARVEIPHWATSAEQIDRLHATIVDQCARCDGYPRVLQEAHEQAVISMPDRLQFDRLLSLEAGRHGLRSRGNSKQASKRRRAV